MDIHDGEANTGPGIFFHGLAMAISEGIPGYRAQKKNSKMATDLSLSDSTCQYTLRARTSRTADVSQYSNAHSRICPSQIKH